MKKNIHNLKQKELENNLKYKAIISKILESKKNIELDLKGSWEVSGSCEDS